MTERKRGLVYPDGEEKSWKEVSLSASARELSQHESRVRETDPVSPPRGFDEWSKVMIERQKQRKEILEIPEQVEVVIDTKHPILLWVVGDVHAGQESVDYEAFASDVEAVKRNDGYTITFGDLTDSLFFGGGYEGLGNQTEEDLYMKAALAELSEDGHLLASFAGDHDSWSKLKMGKRGIYQEFRRQTGAHYLEGVSYIDVRLNNGEGEDVEYKIVGSHRHKGFSVYNDSHAALRQEQDEARGADISITAHKHVKAHNEQVVKFHGGEERKIDYIALGTYKKTDFHSRKHGWPRKGEKSRGGFAIVLDERKKQQTVHWELEDAEEHLRRLQRDGR